VEDGERWDVETPFGARQDNRFGHLEGTPEDLETGRGEKLKRPSDGFLDKERVPGLSA